MLNCDEALKILKIKKENKKKKENFQNIGLMSNSVVNTNTVWVVVDDSEIKIHLQFEK